MAEFSRSQLCFSGAKAFLRGAVLAGMALTLTGCSDEARTQIAIYWANMARGESDAPLPTPRLKRPSQRVRPTPVPVQLDQRIATTEEARVPLQVVRRSLAAFKRGDYDAAWQMQTKQLRAGMKSSLRLKFLIENAYPEFRAQRNIQWRRFLCDAKQDLFWIAFRMDDDAGQTSRILYELKREDGQYRVDAVRVRQSAPVERVAHPAWPFERSFPLPQPDSKKP